MQIFINGAERDVADGCNLAALLKTLELESRHVAVEVNFELVPRAAHGEKLLAPGDRLEVVTLVGGG